MNDHCRCREEHGAHQDDEGSHDGRRGDSIPIHPSILPTKGVVVKAVLPTEDRPYI